MASVRRKRKLNQKKTGHLKPETAPGCLQNSANPDDINPVEYMEVAHQELDIFPTDEGLNTNARELQLKHIYPLLSNQQEDYNIPKFSNQNHTSEVSGLENQRNTDNATNDKKTRGTKREAAKKIKKPTKSILEKLSKKTQTEHMPKLVNRAAQTLKRNASNNQRNSVEKMNTQSLYMRKMFNRAAHSSHVINKQRNNCVAQRSPFHFYRQIWLSLWRLLLKR